MGNNVVLIGLGIQVVFFGLFIITTIVFHVRITKRPTTHSYSVTVPWRMLIVALYVSSILILVRSLFRMVEFGMGNDGLFHKHEAFLFIFDGALMFLACAAFLWYHPGRILVGYKTIGVRSDLEGSSAGYPMTAPGTGQTKTEQTKTDSSANSHQDRR